MKIKDIVIAGLEDGLTTQQIIDRVKSVHPNAKTSPASVAWYKTQLRKTAPPEKKSLLETVTSAPYYEVKNVQLFASPDGGGLNASLYRNGTKVALLHDGGHGGPLEIDWLDKKAPKVDVTVRNYMDATFTRKGTPEEALFYAHIFNMTYHCEYANKDSYMTDDIFINDLVNLKEMEKKVKKLTKGKTCFVDGGEVYTIKAVGPKVLAHVRKEHPYAVVINEMSVKEAAKYFVEIL